MNTLVYELMKNYGFNETKMEVVLYTLLANSKDFRIKFLKEAFKTPFKYDTADIKTEVSRRSMRQGRTDIEVTDEKGRKFILELKVNVAYPTKEQLQMYESIENVVEVATLTNIVDHGKLPHKNTTWKRTAEIINEVLVDSPFYHFINDFGPMNGKGFKEIMLRASSGDVYNTFLKPISNKLGNFRGDWTGVSVLEKFNSYVIPAPTYSVPGQPAKYEKIKDNLQYYAFRKQIDKDGNVNVAVYRIVSNEVLSPEEINSKLGQDVVLRRSDLSNCEDHYLLTLELVEERKVEYGFTNGMVKFYAPVENILDKENKSVAMMAKSIKEDEEKEA